MRRPGEGRHPESLSFLPGITEHLGYYVYALRQPNGRVFYVGKGTGNRVYAHAVEARMVDDSEGANGLKLAEIRRIQKGGREVGIEIIRHGLCERDAYEVESAVIDVLTMEGAELTNLVKGRDSDEHGWQPLARLRAKYGAPPVEIDPRHAVVLIRINRKFRLEMSDGELYDATRRSWIINPERHNPRWAFAVYAGIVRAVYRIDNWEPAPDNERRLGFTGEQDPELESRYVWHQVSHYMQPGAQNPIKYVNC